MTDIYEHSISPQIRPLRAFFFVHCHFSQENINILLDCYHRIKEEHLRENHPMKEMVLQAYQTAYLARFLSFVKKEDVIDHVKHARQYAFFKDFLQMLNDNHKKERSVQYYAEKMHITPKYLSSITQLFTGLSSSQVIDKYVIFAIMQTLYINTHNIKTISAEFNFPSQSFFGRYFKRITGMSPNEYMKKHNRRSLSFDPKTQEEK
jgi:YesN/AraC family two-component response regulator